MNEPKKNQEVKDNPLPISDALPAHLKQESEQSLDYSNYIYKCPDCSFVKSFPKIEILREEKTIQLKCNCEDKHLYDLKTNNFIENLSKIIAPQQFVCNKCKVKFINITNNDNKNGNSNIINNANINSKIEETNIPHTKFYLNPQTFELFCNKCKNSERTNLISLNNYYTSCLIHKKELIGYCRNHQKDVCSDCHEEHYNCEIIFYTKIYPKEKNVEDYLDDIQNRRRFLSDLECKIKSKVNEILKELETYKDLFLSRILLDEIIINTYKNIKNNYSVIQNCNEILSNNNKWDYVFDLQKYNFNEEDNKINKYIKNNNLNGIYNKNIQTIEFKSLITDKAGKGGLDNQFAVFKTFNGDNLVVYSSFSKKKIVSFFYDFKNYTDIECYDLDKQEVIIHIQNAHTNSVDCIKYNDYNKDKKDFILTSSRDNSIKIWDIYNNWTNILNISNIFPGNLKEINFTMIYDNAINKTLILTSGTKKAKMKLYDFTGKFLNEIKNNELIKFLDVFYEKVNNRIYILTSNESSVIVYYYNNNFSIHNIYSDKHKNRNNVIVKEANNFYYLIESDWEGNVRIWNFYTAKLLHKFNFGNTIIRSTTLWGDNSLFVCFQENSLKLIDLNNNGNVIKEYSTVGKLTFIFKCVRKFISPKNGECFITNDFDGNLKLFS